MARKLLPLLLILISPCLHAQKIFDNPLSQRQTNYTIKVRLDTVMKTVSGNLELSWKNLSSEPVGDLQFHMYLNAFKNTGSTFNQEGRTGYSDEMDWGYVEIQQIKTADGEDLMPNMHYIEPDQPQSFQVLRIEKEKPIGQDNNLKDQTVLRVALNKPVLPDSTIVVNMQFTSKLPKLAQRTGYVDNYYFVAQWFPKLAVYEPVGMRYATKGGWNNHQFHRNSEFYANHSVYNVDITLPDNYTVGTGGVLTNEVKHDDGTQTLSYRAEDIVDFAWTTSQDYIVVEDSWRHVAIQVLMQPEHLYQADRHLIALKHALEYLDEHVGPYPWPHATLIDPPSKGQGAGGMEYTTLFTAGTAYGLPKGIHLPELVTIHEFGHAYFMGIFATNEFEEAWMDEGINTYWESRIIDHAYGNNSGVIDLPFVKVGDSEFARLNYVMLRNPKIADAYRNAWEFPHGSYGAVIYQKTATWLITLERMIGQQVMDEIFKRYYQRWAFKHPASHDFIAIVNEVVKEYHGDRFGDSMDWFFDQFLKSDKMVDYAVTGLRVHPVRLDGGIMDHAAGERYLAPEDDEEMFRSTVQLERLEEAIVPVEILIHFDNGEEIFENWNGKERVKDFIYESPNKVDWVKIDPELKILMDKNLKNNSLTMDKNRKPALKYGSKFLFFLQNLMQLVSIIS